MKVALAVATTNPANVRLFTGAHPTQIAGVFVIHGCSSGDAMKHVLSLQKDDITSIELEGTLSEMVAHFGKWGITVIPGGIKNPDAKDA